MWLRLSLSINRSYFLYLNRIDQNGSVRLALPLPVNNGKGWFFMVKKRMVRYAFFLLAALMILLVRLMQIQLLETRDFSGHHIDLIESSVRQRTREVVLDDRRGEFLDRNGEPLVQESRKVLVLFPFLQKMEWDAEAVASILHVDPDRLRKSVEGAGEPVIFGFPDPVILEEGQVQKINQLRIPGVFAVEMRFKRNQTLAGQLIGITGENEKLVKERYPDQNISPNTAIGITGLQKTFDEFLIQGETTRLVYHVDGRGGPLFGIDVKYVDPSNPFYPVKIVTTLDSGIQRELERIVDEHRMEKGGAVLLDIQNSSILAMLSRPQMDPSDPFKNEGARNQTLIAHQPGSVFKTVVAAMAIDYNLASSSRTFDCSRDIRGNPLPGGGHGFLDFEKSFAASCNSAFAELARELSEIDPNLMETYAEKLGLTRQNGWAGDVFHIKNFHQLDGEEVGQVFLSGEEKYDKNYISLTAIGQLNVKVTPLSAANMMATIARGGEWKMVRAVSSIEYRNGTKLYRFPEGNSVQAIKPYTVMKLQELLRKVVTEEVGTGRGLQDLPYSVAGKSGTAETDRNGLENKWFAGYFPFEQPKYALAVFQLDVPEHSGSVVPLFRDMVNYLYQRDRETGHEDHSVQGLSQPFIQESVQKTFSGGGYR